jgi:hypothetical protein
MESGEATDAKPMPTAIAPSVVIAATDVGCSPVHHVDL